MCEPTEEVATPSPAGVIVTERRRTRLHYIGTPEFQVRLHAAMMMMWIIMIPISVMTGLKESVPFLVFISLWALVGSEMASWQAAKGEMRMKRDAKRAQETTPPKHC